MRVDQVQKIIRGYMQNSGRGGFITGTVRSVAPLRIEAGKLQLTEGSLYITDSCIGLDLKLPSKTAELRRGLQPGDGVLLLCRPDNVDGVKYILIDRIQKYVSKREVDGT